jgi:predicted RNase H-like nuclease (RuvC/YqgF family)
MNDRDKLFLDFKSIKNVQNAFEDSMKRLEKSIAESITNKQKLETIKNDMLNANKKYNEAKEGLDQLKSKFKSTK